MIGTPHHRHRLRDEVRVTTSAASSHDAGTPEFDAASKDKRNFTVMPESWATTPVACSRCG